MIEDIAEIVATKGAMAVTAADTIEVVEGGVTVTAEDTEAIMAAKGGVLAAVVRFEVPLGGDVVDR